MQSLFIAAALFAAQAIAEPLCDPTVNRTVPYGWSQRAPDAYTTLKAQLHVYESWQVPCGKFYYTQFYLFGI